MFNALHSFFQTIAKVLVVPAIAMLAFAGHPIPAAVPDLSLDVAHLTQQVQSIQSNQAGLSMNLGATNPIPTSVAIFSTSLQSAIGSSDTSMTLVSAAYNNGASTLASSTYDFIIDEGTASQEFVSADCTATACTNMSRGLDWLNGTTTVSSLQFTHRRGASVKITDAPILLKLNQLALGAMGYPNQIGYKSGFASTSITLSTSFTDKDYVDSTAFNSAGVIKATAAANGTVQIATGLQAASSTVLGSTGATVVIPASIATSTYNSATAALKVVVTNNSGQIDGGFLSQAAPSGAIHKYAATTSAPTGWLFANGQAVSRTTYSSLFNVIGTNYGIGDGATTFNLPSSGSFIGPTLDGATSTVLSAQATTHTWAYTTKTGASLLVVYFDPSATGWTVSSVTYNGVAMTRITDKIAGTTNDGFMYYLINPASGTNNIVITHSGTTNGVTISAASYMGISAFDASSSLAFTSASSTGILGVNTTSAANQYSDLFVAGFGVNPTVSCGTFPASTLPIRTFIGSSGTLNQYFSDNIGYGQTQGIQASWNGCNGDVSTVGATFRAATSTGPFIDIIKY